MIGLRIPQQVGVLFPQVAPYGKTAIGMHYHFHTLVFAVIVLSVIFFLPKQGPGT